MFNTPQWGALSWILVLVLGPCQKGLALGLYFRLASLHLPPSFPHSSTKVDVLIFLETSVYHNIPAKCIMGDEYKLMNTKSSHYVVWCTLDGAKAFLTQDFDQHCQMTILVRNVLKLYLLAMLKIFSFFLCLFGCLVFLGCFLCFLRFIQVCLVGFLGFIFCCFFRFFCFCLFCFLVFWGLLSKN